MTMKRMKIDMNLEEKIQYIIDNYEDGDKIVISYTTSEDNHDGVWQFPNGYIEHMPSYLEDYKKYGEVAGCDPKGVWMRYINFELMKFKGG